MTNEDLRTVMRSKLPFLTVMRLQRPLLRYLNSDPFSNNFRYRVTILGFFQLRPFQSFTLNNLHIHICINIRPGCKDSGLPFIT